MLETPPPDRASGMAAVVAKLRAEDWDPDCPSAECLKATTRPTPFPGSRCQVFDIVGMHWLVVRMELFRKFPDLDGDLLTRVAVGFVGGDLRPERLEALLGRLCAWETGRFHESEKRRASASYEEILADSAHYEPALTYIELAGDRGWTSFSKNREATRLGLLAVESRGTLERLDQLSKKELSELGLANEPSDEDVGKLLEVIIAENPGQSLFDLNDEGEFVLEPRKFRDALERTIEPVAPVREGEQQGRRASEAASEAALSGAECREASPLETAQKREQAEAFLAWLQDRRDKAEPGSHDALAVEHFISIYKGDESIRAVAAENQVNREALRRSLEALRADLGRTLRPTKP